MSESSINVTPRPRISVVIPAFNEEAYVGATIENVKEAIGELHSRYPGEAVEIVVVDNNSRDRTAEVAREHGATVVFESKNQIAAARNAGGRAAAGEIVAFLDADCKISSNLLTLVHETMRTGRYVGGGVDDIRWDADYPLLRVQALLERTFRRLMRVSYGLMFTQKRTFYDVRGFDERYYAAEEGVYIVKLKRFGRRSGLAYGNLKDGYVTYSARKYETASTKELAALLLKFVLFPWNVRRRSATGFWYDIDHRDAPSQTA